MLVVVCSIPLRCNGAEAHSKKQDSNWLYLVLHANINKPRPNPNGTRPIELEDW